jgi:hypothetical protein
MHTRCVKELLSGMTGGLLGHTGDACMHLHVLGWHASNVQVYIMQAPKEEWLCMCDRGPCGECRVLRVAADPVGVVGAALLADLDNVMGPPAAGCLGVCCRRCRTALAWTHLCQRIPKLQAAGALEAVLSHV